MRNTKQRIHTALQSHFPNNHVAQEHFGELLTHYVESGLAPPHLVNEIEAGVQGKLWSYIWEAMLYRHLNFLGFTLQSSVTKAGQHGPDFRIDYEGRTIWIEAIAPSPEGIPGDWLEPVRRGEFRIRSKPDQPRVLRCTQAIGDKQKKFAKYLDEGIIGANDCAVIAVNICQLSDWDVDGNGISQLPLVMEAVFPVGPLGVQISRDGKLDGPARNLQRPVLKKSNGSEVQTTSFLDEKFANVSAILQAHQRDMFEKELILSMVHNPLARNALPINLLHSCKEFIAEDRGEEFQIRNVAMRTPVPE